MNIVFYTSDDWYFSEPIDSNSNSITRLNGDPESICENLLTVNADIYLFGGFRATDQLIDELKILTDKKSQAVFVLCVSKADANPEFLLKAMRAGVREVILNNTTEEITGVLARCKAFVQHGDNVSASSKAQCIGFMSAKGGDGGTCIIANVASELAKNKDLRVIAVDLSLQYGDLEIYLTNETATNELTEFSESIERMDTTLLNLMVHHVTDNLDLIPSPSTLEKILEIHVEKVEKLIDILCENYDFVLIDIGTGLDPISLRIWDQLDKLVLISTLSVPSARRASQILRLWDNMGLTAAKANIVINRYGGPADIAVDDYQSAVGKKIWHITYGEYLGIQESLLKGVPVVDIRPNSKFTKSIIEISSELSGNPIKVKRSLWDYLGIK